LNILATGHAAALCYGRQLLLAPKIRAESLFVYDSATRENRISIDAHYLAEQRINTLAVDLTDSEKAMAVRFAADVDDGEAESLAIAHERGIPLLSDDVRAGRIATQLGIRLQTTLELLHNWSAGRTALELREAACGLRDRASYAAPRTHPLRDWFLTLIAEDA